MTNHIPASGERAALVGYTAQYRIAAELIYSRLIDGTLQWIGLTDPEAGRVDDIQIATSTRIDAYQVKWGEQTGSISFSALIEGKGDPDIAKSEGLIGQLAGGWKRLQAKAEGKRVVVHLIARDIAAPKAKIPHETGIISRANLQGMLTDCWESKVWVKGGLKNCPAGWGPALRSLLNASCLTEPEFLKFIPDCQIELGYRIEAGQEIQSRDELRRREDIEDLASFLYKTVGAEKRTIRLQKSELLNRLGWSDRFNPRFVHEFPVSELYQPINTTVNALNNALSKYRQGYLAVLGTPGSGKSTTLTHTLRYRRGCRVIRYYAYVPDSPFQGRGEATSFLHDVVHGLQSIGASSGLGQARSREELLEKLSTQLASLHEKWKEDGIFTLILVDGLDHIEREQSPERSLLNDLPHPSSVPEGVILILGSQSLNLDGLSSAVKSHLEESGRQVIMSPLSRPAVLAIADVIKTPTTLTVEQKDEVLNISGGHPLALSYLIKSLGSAVTPEDITKILSSSNPYQGHIDNTYEIYWKELEPSLSLKDLLALLARTRTSFDPRELISWAGEETVLSLISKASSYFHKEPNNRWRFFHNSFRQFLINKTTKDILGVSDPKINQSYHSRLARIFSQPHSQTERAWEAIYHFACAEDWQAVISIATQKYFRDQFYSLRPIEKITDDITIALRSARESHAPLATIRLLLIESELRERQSVIDQANLPDLTFDLFGPEEVIGSITEHGTLKVDPRVALKICKRLIKAGHASDARTIFDAAEPLDLLKGNCPIDRHSDDPKVLKRWAECVFYFRPLPEIFATLNALDLTPQQEVEPEADPNQDPLSIRLLELIAHAIAQHGEPEIWQEFQSLLDSQPGGEHLSIEFDFDICHFHPRHSYAEVSLQRLIELNENHPLEDEDKVIIAEFLVRTRSDFEAARQLISGIRQPPSYTWSGGGSLKNLAPYRQRIRLNRLLSSLGDKTDPSTVVPDSEKADRRGHVLFERHIVSISTLWGAARGGNILTGSEVVRILKPSIQFFNRGHKESRKWHAWYELEQAADDYFDLLIAAASAHGVEAVLALEAEFENQWSNPETSKYWSTARQHRIARNLFKHGGSKAFFSRLLERLEERLGIWHELHERAEELSALAISWNEIGEHERARALIPRLLSGSFGIYHHKDRQMQTWVSYLKIAGKANPELVENDLARFASAILILQRAGRGRGTQDAATELISLAASISPRLGWNMFNWLLSKGGLYFEHGLAGLLLGGLRSRKISIWHALAVTAHLYAPFSRTTHDQLASELATACITHYGESKSKEILGQLAEKLQVYSWPSERSNWWKGFISALRRQSIDSSYFEALLGRASRKRDYDSSSLLMKDGRKISTEEFPALVRSFDDFRNLIDHLQKTEYFPWQDALSPILGGFNASQISQTADLLEPFGLNNTFRCRLALRLQELNFPDKATAIVQRFLEQSSSHGWDGGSHVYAFRTLINIDPDKWRPLALERFIDDYLAEFRYPQQLIQNIDEFASLFFQEIPWNELWPEIRDHVSQLAEFSLADEIPSLNEGSQISHDEVILNSICFSFLLPINEVRDHAFNALHACLVESPSSVFLREFIDASLNKSDSSTPYVLALLDSLWRSGIGLAKDYESLLYTLCQSPSYVVRNMAASLLKAMGKSAETIFKRSESSLPLQYQFQYPSLQSRDLAIPAGAISGSDFLPDSADALELIRPHVYEIEWLSEASGFPLENILERTVSLMRSIQDESSWNKAAEMHLRQWLDEINLQLSFNRARPKIAAEAISHAVAELADVGRLSEDELGTALNWLTIYDWRLSNRNPKVRPSSILPFSAPEHFSFREEWAKTPTGSLDLFVSHLEDGYAVVGELTKFRAWEWETPTERRFTVACHSSWHFSKTDVNAYNVFPHIQHWKARDYPFLQGVRGAPALVIFGAPRQELIGASDWLAFNPEIAYSLGWSLSEEGLFRWVNDNHEVMVESRLWQDGPTQRQPPRTREITGKGWLVVASPAAQKIIRDRLPSLATIRAVNRRLAKSGDREEMEGSAIVKVDVWPPNSAR